MRQLTHKLKNGILEISEVPPPIISKGNIFVKNHYSVISAGTELSTVKAAKKNLIGKAKERPQQFRQVIDTLVSQGPVQTYRAVMKKLDTFSSIGYSCAGKVIEVADDVEEFLIGDFVACGGLSASHSEIVAVHRNLCAKLSNSCNIPESQHIQMAAYNTLGAISLQGVRQANLKLGETCAVIGLGLLGHITSLLLQISGVKVIGVDIDSTIVEMARDKCVDLGLVRDTAGIEDKITRFTEGIGCDAVIIAAASNSLDPINFAGAILKKRGTVVVLGAVPTGFDREPHFYKKEIQIKMSCSYGPGRYDPQYEEKGVDYPPAYVRWTEQRNMQAFQELIASGKIDLRHLTTHKFKLEDAPKAYDIMMKKSEPFMGILIEYDHERENDNRKVVLNCSTSSHQEKDVSLGFIGAGSYAQSHLLPNLPKNSRVKRKGVMTSSGASSMSVADRFGFDFCSSDEMDFFQNKDINTVFVASRHDSHADYVVKSLREGKHVFVEKPLCLSDVELYKIKVTIDSNGHKHKGSNEVVEQTNKIKQPNLMVGYNRRFSPLALSLKDALGEGPKAMTYRINAGTIPADSWIQDVEIGGGRIIGEVCHFLDLFSFICGALPTSVNATAMIDPLHLNDIVNISLTYKNGSIGNIGYFSNGDKSLPKERIEVFSNGTTGIIHDFKKLEIYAGGKKKVKKLISQDKGQKQEMYAFIDAILTGEPSPIPLDEIFTTSLTTFKIMESLRTGQTITIK